MKHEIVICPKCNGKFECKLNRISNCQCVNFQLSSEQVLYLREKYDNCLCHRCLNQIQKTHQK